MQTVDWVLVIVLAIAAVVCGFAVWALRETGLAMRAVRLLAEDVRPRAVRLLDKADVTFDALNAELLRVDLLVTRLEEAADRVSSASETIGDIVAAPGEIVSGLAHRFRRAWQERLRPEAKAVSGGLGHSDAGQNGRERRAEEASAATGRPGRNHGS